MAEIAGHTIPNRSPLLAFFERWFLTTNQGDWLVIFMAQFRAVFYCWGYGNGHSPGVGPAWHAVYRSAFL